MKEKELRKHANCTLCRRPIGHTGVPLFWRVTLEQYGVDLQAVQRQDGLTAAMGDNPALAAVLGPDEDMARMVTGPLVVTVCHDCALNMSDAPCVYQMAEQAEEQSPPSTDQEETNNTEGRTHER